MPLSADDSTGSHRRASESFDFTLNGNRAERVQIVNMARERVLAVWRRRQSLALRLQGLGAARHGVTVLNSPGTIDADYRGELQVILVNISSENFVIQRGMRIAQLVIAPILHAKLVESVSLEATKRAAGGFGSTGTAANIVDNRG